MARKEWNLDSAKKCVVRNGVKVKGRSLHVIKAGIKVQGAIDYLVKVHNYKRA